MIPEQKRVNVSWQEVEVLVKRIVSAVQDDELRISNVYGVPRGGLPVAVMVSHQLDLPMVLDCKDITGTTLIVDDIIDSGATINKLMEKYPIEYVASLYSRPGVTLEKTVMVNATAKTTSWVIFPWETNETSKYDGTI